MDGTGTSPGPSLISLLCPTRHRPQRVLTMVRSALETAERPKLLEFLFYVDDDDLSIYNVRWPCDRSGCSTKVKVRAGPRQPMQGDNWNLAYELAKGDILMVAADDIVFQTAGWDSRIRHTFDEYPDKIVLVYAGDCPSGDRFVQATHPFLHRRWIETLGYVLPPYFEVYWVDQWLQELADRISRRVYLADVSIEHVHWMGGRVERDATYRDAQAREDEAHPGVTWVRTAGERVKDAKKLQQAIDSSAREPRHTPILGS